MKAAIIVVDVQNDFMDKPKGALPVPGASAVVPTIVKLIEGFPTAMVVYTQDWHPVKTKHFDKWPAHCIARSKGSLLVNGLPVTANDYYVLKGTGTEDDGYSGFDGKEALTNHSLDLFLKHNDITHLYVCGVATEYCVKATCLDGRLLGYTTFLVTNAIAGLTDEAAAEAIEAMQQVGVHMMVVS